MFTDSRKDQNTMSYFQHFKEDVSGIELPQKFTFPFYYDPHPLSLIAVKEIQTHLENQTDFEHNFGLGKTDVGIPIGKMFGVMVVQNQQNEIGYLAAFSGKLSDGSLPEKFVPPVYNAHAQNSFYKIGEIELNKINQEISDLEKEPRFIEMQQLVESKTISVTEELKREKEKLKISKKDRKLRREKARVTLSPEAFIIFNKQLADESIKGQFLFKELSTYLKEELAKYQKDLAVFTSKIAELKAARKNKSGILQRQIFDNYQFLNQQKIKKGLTAIFPKFREQKPPSGAGDCSAPKLLQYAFLNDLKPIAMAEFWWGKSPSTEIRKHKNFYPACRGRCKPILAHMLEGIEMDENPLLKNPAENKKIKIVFEDDDLVIINKPAEFLSVPGKEISDSVYTRMQAMYPDATGPMIVHRLDMSTSGILIITKTKEAHKFMQRQFRKRIVKKRYVALLDGRIEGQEGDISLPLRVDLDDRPRQMVCYEHGKNAETKWKVIQRFDNKTRIYLFPITGRTHQLRVHVAHPLGLNTPIIGDDLYGVKGERLHLHAEYIEFTHPSTREEMSFTVESDF